MVTIVAHTLLFSHSATCAAEQTTPNITRSQPGPALTGPVVVGVNETISIWCSAKSTVMFTGHEVLLDLFWRYRGTRLPAIDRWESTDLHVYEERYGVSAGTVTWKRVLHFRRAQPPSAGHYTCVANYSQTLKSQSVEVRITGARLVYCTGSSTK